MINACLEFTFCALTDCSCGENCADCGFLEEEHEAVYSVDTCSDRVVVHLRPGQPVELRNEADEVVLIALPQPDGTMKVGVASEPYNDDACGCADTPYVCGGCDEEPELSDTCVDCGGPLACPHGVNPEDKCGVCDFVCDGSGRCPPVE